jgi:hypothetical protein
LHLKWFRKGVPHLGRTGGRAELDRLLIVGLEASYDNRREGQTSEIWYPELSLSLQVRLIRETFWLFQTYATVSGRFRPQA